MHNEPFIIVSGLPASGKTAIGRHVADAMCLPFLDKDDFLEHEFEKQASIDLEMRQKLSRQSDQTMKAEAMRIGSGVLVSFWRPPQRAVTYGTATDWISNTGVPVMELYCQCQAQIARQRFVSRKRHSGHNDSLRMETLVQQFDELAALGPLGLWPVVTINTDTLQDIRALRDEAIEGIQALLK